MESIGFLKTILSTLWGTYAYQGLFYMSLLIILAVSKNQWKKYTYAVYSLIVLVGLLNPVSITIAEWLWGNSVAYYCRLFSMIQIIAVIAFAIVLILNKLRALVKPFAVCAVIAIIIVGGNCVYLQDWYAKAENIEKIPEDVKLISEAFEKLNGVVIAAPNSMTSYIRQYDASIKMVTGRDSSTELSRQLESDTPDVGYIMSSAGMLGAEYVIINRSDEAIQCFDNNGYKPWYKSDGFYIYRVSGYDSIRKEYNDEGEVVSISYLDKEGNLAIGDRGYAIVKYQYDKKGRKAKELYYGIDNNLERTLQGNYCGIIYIYDKKNRNVKAVYVDENGESMNTLWGYATWERIYDNRGFVIGVYYRDKDNNPALVGEQYTAIKYECRDDGKYSKITYCDKNWNPIVLKSGYTSENMIYDSKGRVSERRYYDSQDQLIENSMGYCRVTYIYDDYGNILETKYYDINNNNIKQ